MKAWIIKVSFWELPVPYGLQNLIDFNFYKKMNLQAKIDQSIFQKTGGKNCY